MAAVVLMVGASFALGQVGDDRTSPPVGPPTTTPTGTVEVPPTTDGSRPLTYGLGATIHYGDRVIEAAEDPDGLYVFDDGLWFFTGEMKARVRPTCTTPTGAPSRSRSLVGSTGSRPARSDRSWCGWTGTTS